jgi:diguanylate cyclase (GGDEF)-like protein
MEAMQRSTRLRAVANSPRVKVNAFTVTLVCFAALMAAITSQYARPGSPALMGVRGFLILAILFAASEYMSLHLHVGVSGYTFSVTEATLVISFFHSSPLTSVLAQLFGAVVVLVGIRKQRSIKVVFNLAMFAVANQLAFACFLVIGKGARAWPLQGPRAWIATYSSVGIFTMLSTVLVFGVIYLASPNEFSLRTLVSNFRIAMFPGLATTSIGIAASTLAYDTAPAAILLMLPIIGTWLINRRYLSERRRTEELVFLQQSSEVLHGAVAAELALPAVLEAARTEFCVKLIEFEYRADGMAQSIRVEHAKSPELFVPNSSLLVESSPPRATIVTAQDDSYRIVANALVARDVSVAVVAPVVISGRTEGVLLIADPLADHDKFGNDDLRMAEMLAHHVASAMQNGRLEQSVAELRNLEGKLLFELQHDPLTSLMNRSTFTRRARETMERDTPGRFSALLFVDLDDFKAVNDSFGHAAGDALLQEIGKRLTHVLRPHDYAARLGGDEFAVLLHPVGRGDEARSAAARILEKLAEPFEIGRGEMVFPRVSIGIALATPEDDIESLFERADAAMYRAKGSGKGRIEIVDLDADEHTKRAFDLGSELESALSNGHVDLQFHAVHALHDSALDGYAGVLRWNHPIFGRLSPADFFGPGVRGPIQRELRRIMVRTAVDALRELETIGFRGWCSVNLTAPQLLDDTLLTELADTCREYGVSADRLRIEIEQQVFARSSDTVARRLDEVQACGFRIVLNNVGLDDTTIGLIERTAPALVKLSEQIIRELTNRKAGAPFIRSIVDLGKDVGFEVIATGVASAEDIAAMRSFGCQFGQGDALSSIASLEHLLGRSPVVASEVH